jgi:hypothetical protein
MAVNVTNASRSVLDAGLEDAMTNRSNGSGQYLESNPELQLFFAVILSFSAAVGVFGNILIILTVAMTKVRGRKLSFDFNFFLFEFCSSHIGLHSLRDFQFLIMEWLV